MPLMLFVLLEPTNQKEWPRLFLGLWNSYRESAGDNFLAAEDTPCIYPCFM